jgi:hypothetical protein
MGDPDAGSGRLTKAGSRQRRYRSFAASGPGVRVIELHILGMQIQLLSINMGRRWSPLSSCRSAAEATHWRVDRTITVEGRHGSVNRYEKQYFIKHRQLLLPSLSEVLESLRRTILLGLVASSVAAKWNYHTSRRSVQR